MLWLVYALISAFATGINRVFHRVVMLKEDTISYSCLFNIIGGLFFIPLLIKEFIFPLEIFPWILVGIAAALWAIETFVSFESFAYVPVSIKSPMDETRVVFLLILSVLILSESLFIEKIAGTLLIFIGIVILTYKDGRFFVRFAEKGTKLIAKGS